MSALDDYWVRHLLADTRLGKDAKLAGLTILHNSPCRAGAVADSCECSIPVAMGLMQVLHDLGYVIGPNIGSRHGYMPIMGFKS